MRAEKAKEESDDRQAEDRRNRNANQQWRLHSEWQPPSFHNSMRFEQYSAGRDGSQHEETEARSRFAIEPAGESSSDRRPRARDTRNQRERLCNPDENGINRVDSCKGPPFATKLFRNPHEKTDDD